jgi:hypothetical protein
MELDDDPASAVKAPAGKKKNASEKYQKVRFP